MIFWLLCGQDSKNTLTKEETHTHPMKTTATTATTDAINATNTAAAALLLSPCKVEFELGGQKLTLETGRLARQASGSVLISAGRNMVLATVVSEKKPSTLDFFPLTVEYSERFYSTGRIPGGYFKREGRPGTDAILNCRLLDRPLRPLFPKGYRFETQLVATILSADGMYPMHSLAGIAASAALMVSDIPFAGPMCLVDMGQEGSNWALNPSFAKAGQAPQSSSPTRISVAGTPDGLLMVEGECGFLKESQVVEGLAWAHKQMQVVFEAQKELAQKIGKTKREFTPPMLNEQVLEKTKTKYLDDIKKALSVKPKKQRQESLKAVKSTIVEDSKTWSIDSLEPEAVEAQAAEAFAEIKCHTARSNVLQDAKRIDGRALDEVRPIACSTALLPHVHGSALFTRGETQVLGALTLGTPDDEQRVDTLGGTVNRRFFLHYNFPPYCVGEVGRMGGQSRREIGHGNLAERAIKAVLPDYKDFAYTIRLVSEVLESNGSSSMGTVCSSSMALMDGGVPIKAPVAGVAMGLISDGKTHRVLSDILGDEDALGDMDFKVAGTKEAITALQMDIKVKSLSFEVLAQALEQARKARVHILDQMEKAINKHRAEVSPYAPRTKTLRVKPEKIKTIIGVGGKTIKSIVEKTGVKINLEDDGKVHIASVDPEATKRAEAMVKDLVAEAEVGKVYDGKVQKVVEFGAFVQILPNTSGLLHISEISKERIRKVEDHLQEGDNIKVKVLDVDRAGRIRLSKKAMLER